MFKHLINIIKSMEGTILTIGIDEKLLSGFNKNSKVNVFTLDKNYGYFKKEKKKKKMNGKTININRLHKYFKKKSVDYIICDYNEINDYIKCVIRDIIKINSRKLYLYCDFDDVQLIVERFQRYGSQIELFEFKDKCLLEISNENSHTNWLKNKIYYLSDTGYDIVDFISNILIS